jgi:ribosomal protein S27E
MLARLDVGCLFVPPHSEKPNRSSHMASLPCQFCGKEAGFFSGRSNMYRCAACGTVLCDNCTGKRFSLPRGVFSLTCLVLTPFLWFPLVGVALVGFRDLRCLKCGGGVKKIT